MKTLNGLEFDGKYVCLESINEKAEKEWVNN